MNVKSCFRTFFALSAITVLLASSVTTANAMGHSHGPTQRDPSKAQEERARDLERDQQAVQASMQAELKQLRKELDEVKEQLHASNNKVSINQAVPPSN